MSARASHTRTRRIRVPTKSPTSSRLPSPPSRTASDRWRLRPTTTCRRYAQPAVQERVAHSSPRPCREASRRPRSRTSGARRCPLPAWYSPPRPCRPRKRSRGGCSTSPRTTSRSTPTTSRAKLCGTRRSSRTLWPRGPTPAPRPWRRRRGRSSWPTRPTTWAGRARLCRSNPTVSWPSGWWPRTRPRFPRAW